jgi:hypothetical protein
MKLCAVGIVAIAVLMGGCFPFDETQELAPREMVVAAAERCGVPRFEPTPVGSGFAARVADTVPDGDRKEACIIEDVEQRQLYKLER